MDIIISNEAAEWYKAEYELKNNASLRFFVRYGGIGGNVPGFSLGVNLESPMNIHTSITVNDILFYIEESDAWYFDDKDLLIKLDERLNEPQFSYE
ncbi:hypothetical protein SPD48_03730 [Pseudogracilibacillus sp. SE30717A]|uniref:HesB/YadR/YfhF family protein n=1 Tax=Pseudogracilibacillus sp. SE30717A TaxID=3098293 RepID=UPI00300E3E85